MITKEKHLKTFLLIRRDIESFVGRKQRGEMRASYRAKNVSGRKKTLSRFKVKKDLVKLTHASPNSEKGSGSSMKLFGALQGRETRNDEGFLPTLSNFELPCQALL